MAEIHFNLESSVRLSEPQQLAKDRYKPTIDIAFEKINYEIQIAEPKTKVFEVPKKSKKRILSDVTGCFKGRRVNAIMGTSGAGKTSLLNILACRVKSENSCFGDKDSYACNFDSLYANRQKYGHKEFGRFANLVEQFDQLFETLTVRQTLSFAYEVSYAEKNSAEGISKQQYVREKVIELANQLKLQKCLDTMIGGNLIKGVSGGEKKRVSIAYELIMNPAVLMLDEPTSGLDSLTSYIIVRYLKKLAHEEGKNIIMTIHQPNNEIFDLIDSLTLLAQGKIVYQGQATQAVQYFEGVLKEKLPRETNPPDFLISQLHEGTFQQEGTHLTAVHESYETRQLPQIQEEIGKQLYSSSSQSLPQNLFKKQESSVKTQFSSLLRRQLKISSRNSILIKIRFIQIFFLGLFVGGMFESVGGADYTDRFIFRSLAGVLFFVGIHCVTLSMTQVALTFPEERSKFLREQQSRLYGVGSYFWSKTLIDLPYLVVFPLLYGLILYWFVGLANTARQFFLFYLILLLSYLTGSSIGLLLGSIIKDKKQISQFSSVTLLPVTLFAGFIKNREDFPSWIGWAQYISPLKYSFTALLKNQTSDVPSLISAFNFNVSVQVCIVVLISITVALRLFAWLFLYLFRYDSK